MSGDEASGALVPRTERTERLAALRAWLEEFRDRRGDDELAWIATPPILVRSLLFFEGRSAPKPLAPERAEAVLAKFGRRPGEGWAMFGEHLVLTSTENQRRSLMPIAQRLGAERQPSPSARASDARSEELGRRALRLADELIALAAEASLQLPERRRLYLQLVGAAAALARAEALLEVERPAGAVVGNTHSLPGRALVLAARRAGVPSVYVPHAPVITDARLVDLPVDRAALRGPEEIAYYETFGADSTAMVAIGNPAVDAAGPMPHLRADARPVFALPHYDGGMFEALVTLVWEGLGDGVVASPHPRGSREFLRTRLPGEWELWEGRTFDLVREGAPAVIQFSSGAALESLQLGVPTIELAFPGEEPKYPFLRHPGVPIVSTAEGLREAMAEASRIAPEGREELRAWTRGWVSADAEAAADAGAEAIHGAPASGPCWDAWRPRPRSLLSRLVGGRRA